MKKKRFNKRKTILGLSSLFGLTTIIALSSILSTTSISQSVIKASKLNAWSNGISNLNQLVSTYEADINSNNPALIAQAQALVQNYPILLQTNTNYSYLANYLDTNNANGMALQVPNYELANPNTIYTIKVGLEQINPKAIAQLPANLQGFAIAFNANISGNVNGSVINNQVLFAVPISVLDTYYNTSAIPNTATITNISFNGLEETCYVFTLSDTIAQTIQENYFSTSSLNIKNNSALTLFDTTQIANVKNTFTLTDDLTNGNNNYAWYTNTNASVYQSNLGYDTTIYEYNTQLNLSNEASGMIGLLSGMGWNGLKNSNSNNILLTLLDNNSTARQDYNKLLVNNTSSVQFIAPQYNFPQGVNDGTQSRIIGDDSYNYSNVGNGNKYNTLTSGNEGISHYRGADGLGGDSEKKFYLGSMGAMSNISNSGSGTWVNNINPAYNYGQGLIKNIATNDGNAYSNGLSNMANQNWWNQANNNAFSHSNQTSTQIINNILNSANDITGLTDLQNFSNVTSKYSANATYASTMTALIASIATDFTAGVFAWPLLAVGAELVAQTAWIGQNWPQTIYNDTAYDGAYQQAYGWNGDGIGSSNSSSSSNDFSFINANNSNNSSNLVQDIINGIITSKVITGNSILPVMNTLQTENLYTLNFLSSTSSSDNAVFSSLNFAETYNNNSTNSFNASWYSDITNISNDFNFNMSPNLSILGLNTNNWTTLPSFYVDNLITKTTYNKALASSASLYPSDNGNGYINNIQSSIYGTYSANSDDNSIIKTIKSTASLGLLNTSTSLNQATVADYDTTLVNTYGASVNTAINTINQYVPIFSNSEDIDTTNNDDWYTNWTNFYNLITTKNPNAFSNISTSTIFNIMQKSNLFALAYSKKYKPNNNPTLADIFSELNTLITSFYSNNCTIILGNQGNIYNLKNIESNSFQGDITLLNKFYNYLMNAIEPNTVSLSTNNINNVIQFINLLLPNKKLNLTTADYIKNGQNYEFNNYQTIINDLTASSYYTTIQNLTAVYKPNTSIITTESLNEMNDTSITEINNLVQLLNSTSFLSALITSCQDNTNAQYTLDSLHSSSGSSSSENYTANEYFANGAIYNLWNFYSFTFSTLQQSDTKPSSLDYNGFFSSTNLVNIIQNNLNYTIGFLITSQTSSNTKYQLLSYYSNSSNPNSYVISQSSFDTSTKKNITINDDYSTIINNINALVASGVSENNTLILSNTTIAIDNKNSKSVLDYLKQIEQNSNNDGIVEGIVSSAYKLTSTINSTNIASILNANTVNIEEGYNVNLTFTLNQDKQTTVQKHNLSQLLNGYGHVDNITSSGAYFIAPSSNNAKLTSEYIADGGYSGTNWTSGSSYNSTYSYVNTNINNNNLNSTSSDSNLLSNFFYYNQWNTTNDTWNSNNAKLNNLNDLNTIAQNITMSFNTSTTSATIDDDHTTDVYSGINISNFNLYFALGSNAPIILDRSNDEGVYGYGVPNILGANTLNITIDNNNASAIYMQTNMPWKNSIDEMSTFLNNGNAWTQYWNVLTKNSSIVNENSYITNSTENDGSESYGYSYNPTINLSSYVSYNPNNFYNKADSYILNFGANTEGNYLKILNTFAHNNIINTFNSNNNTLLKTLNLKDWTFKTTIAQNVGTNGSLTTNAINGFWLNSSNINANSNTKTVTNNLTQTAITDLNFCYAHYYLYNNADYGSMDNSANIHSILDNSSNNILSSTYLSSLATNGQLSNDVTNWWDANTIFINDVSGNRYSMLNNANDFGFSLSGNSDSIFSNLISAYYNNNALTTYNGFSALPTDSSQTNALNIYQNYFADLLDVLNNKVSGNYLQWLNNNGGDYVIGLSNNAINALSTSPIGFNQTILSNLNTISSGMSTFYGAMIYNSTDFKNTYQIDGTNVVPLIAYAPQISLEELINNQKSLLYSNPIIPKNTKNNNIIFEINVNSDIETLLTNLETNYNKLTSGYALQIFKNIDTQLKQSSANNNVLSSPYYQLFSNYLSNDDTIGSITANIAWVNSIENAIASFYYNNRIFVNGMTLSTQNEELSSTSSTSLKLTSSTKQEDGTAITSTALKSWESANLTPTTNNQNNLVYSSTKSSTSTLTNGNNEITLLNGADFFNALLTLKNSNSQLWTVLNSGNLYLNFDFAYSDGLYNQNISVDNEIYNNFNQPNYLSLGQFAFNQSSNSYTLQPNFNTNAQNSSNGFSALTKPITNNEVNTFIPVLNNNANSYGALYNMSLANMNQTTNQVWGVLGNKRLNEANTLFNDKSSWNWNTDTYLHTYLVQGIGTTLSINVNDWLQLNSQLTSSSNQTNFDNLINAWMNLMSLYNSNSNAIYLPLGIKVWNNSTKTNLINSSINLYSQDTNQTIINNTISEFDKEINTLLSALTVNNSDTYLDTSSNQTYDLTYANLLGALTLYLNYANTNKISVSDMLSQFPLLTDYYLQLWIAYRPSIVLSNLSFVTNSTSTPTNIKLATTSSSASSNNTIPTYTLNTTDFNINNVKESMLNSISSYINTTNNAFINLSKTNTSTPNATSSSSASINLSSATNNVWILPTNLLLHTNSTSSQITNSAITMNMYENKTLSNQLVLTPYEIQIRTAYNTVISLWHNLNNNISTSSMPSWWNFNNLHSFYTSNTVSTALNTTSNTSINSYTNFNLSDFLNYDMALNNRFNLPSANTLDFIGSNFNNDLTFDNFIFNFNPTLSFANLTTNSNTVSSVKTKTTTLTTTNSNINSAISNFGAIYLINDNTKTYSANWLLSGINTIFNTLLNVSNNSLVLQNNTNLITSLTNNYESDIFNLLQNKTDSSNVFGNAWNVLINANSVLGYDKAFNQPIPAGNINFISSNSINSINYNTSNSKWVNNETNLVFNPNNFDEGDASAIINYKKVLINFNSNNALNNLTTSSSSANVLDTVKNLTTTFSIDEGTNTSNSSSSSVTLSESSTSSSSSDTSSNNSSSGNLINSLNQNANIITYTYTNNTNNLVNSNDSSFNITNANDWNNAMISTRNISNILSSVLYQFNNATSGSWFNNNLNAYESAVSIVPELTLINVINNYNNSNTNLLNNSNDYSNNLLSIYDRMFDILNIALFDYANINATPISSNNTIYLNSPYYQQNSNKIDTFNVLNNQIDLNQATNSNVLNNLVGQNTNNNMYGSFVYPKIYYNSNGNEDVGNLTNFMNNMSNFYAYTIAYSNLFSVSFKVLVNTNLTFNANANNDTTNINDYFNIININGTNTKTQTNMNNLLAYNNTTLIAPINFINLDNSFNQNITYDTYLTKYALNSTTWDEDSNQTYYYDKYQTMNSTIGQNDNQIGNILNPENTFNGNVYNNSNLDINGWSWNYYELNFPINSSSVFASLPSGFSDGNEYGSYSELSLKLATLLVNYNPNVNNTLLFNNSNLGNNIAIASYYTTSDLNNGNNQVDLNSILNNPSTSALSDTSYSVNENNITNTYSLSLSSDNEVEQACYKLIFVYNNSSQVAIYLKINNAMNLYNASIFNMGNGTRFNNILAYYSNLSSTLNSFLTKITNSMQVTTNYNNAYGSLGVYNYNTLNNSNDKDALVFNPIITKAIASGNSSNIIADLNNVLSNYSNDINVSDYNGMTGYYAIYVNNNNKNMLYTQLGNLYDYINNLNGNISANNESIINNFLSNLSNNNQSIYQFNNAFSKSGQLSNNEWGLIKNNNGDYVLVLNLTTSLNNSTINNANGITHKTSFDYYYLLIILALLLLLFTAWLIWYLRKNRNKDRKLNAINDADGIISNENEETINLDNDKTNNTTKKEVVKKEKVKKEKVKKQKPAKTNKKTKADFDDDSWI